MERPDAVAETQKVYAAEAAIAGVRVAVILLNTVAYAFFLDRAGTFPWLAYTVIGAANAYGLGVLLLQPYRRYPVMLSSYFTTLFDAVFITVWLFATGGFESPFYLLWMLSVTAVAFRYDLRATFLAAGIYAACYVGLLAALGELAPHAPDVGLRLGYVFLTAALGGLLSRELSAQTRAKVEVQALADALRDSEERFRRLSDASFEGIAIHEGGVILEVNASFARMFGYAPGELIGKGAQDLVHPSSLPVVQAHIATPTDESYNALGLRKDGTTFAMELTARHFPWNGRSVRVVAVHDVTEREKAERASREREALAIQNERLRELDGIKSTFINNAAHELGTPLTPIKLQTHLLKLGGFGELNEKQRRAVDVLSRNVDHLGLMVRDLLDASRVQSHDLRLVPNELDLDKLLSEAVESFGDARGVALRYEGSPGLIVSADSPRLMQVVFNLLGNAVKFTPPGGRIDVRARRDGGHVHVEVADTGPGLSREDAARLFKPFSQVHDTSTESRSGAGLGLYIAKGIVESHGGRIWVTSPGQGKGSTFHVTLPLAAAPRAMG